MMGRGAPSPLFTHISEINNLFVYGYYSDCPIPIFLSRTNTDRTLVTDVYDNNWERSAYNYDFRLKCNNNAQTEYPERVKVRHLVTVYHMIRPFDTKMGDSVLVRYILPEL